MFQSPGMLILLFVFMVFPLIAGGKIEEKGATIVASLIGAVFSSPTILIVYALVIGIVYQYFH